MLYSSRALHSTLRGHNNAIRSNNSNCRYTTAPLRRDSHRSSMSSQDVRVTGFDHIVLRVNDPVASVEWYASKLGLETVRLDEYKAGKVPFPSVRVSPTFLIDLFPKQKPPASGSAHDKAPAAQGQAASTTGSGSPDTSTNINVDHFCLVVAGDDIEAVRKQLAAVGVAAEKQFDGVVVKRFGAQGDAQSIYIRDLDSNVVELRTYGAHA